VTIHYRDDWLTVMLGDCRDVMRSMPAESVHMVVTSPPYWGLRDYGSPGQLGLEPTPEAYVESMVAVFREVRRVLRSDGTVWLNLGDSYAGSWGNQGRKPERGTQRPINGEMLTPVLDGRYPAKESNTGAVPPGLKPKDLVGIPWRVAFALQADGWYLRSEIIWAKSNPMPESVTDRPTKAHEQVFLLTKSARYFFDADAVREGIGEARVVEGSNGHGQTLVLGQDFGLESESPHANAVGVRLASAILERARGQHELGLSALDAQVGQERGQDDAGARTVGDPVMRRAAAEASRFADGDVAAKEFLREVDSLCVALPDGHDLKELRTRCTAAVLVDADGDGPIAIDDAREVGQLQLIHDEKYTAEPTPRSSRERNVGGRSDGFTRMPGGEAEWRDTGQSGRNIRSVWMIPTAPYPGSHFATFPQALVEPCIKAGTSERGVCPECGAPWERVVEREAVPLQATYNGAQVREGNASDPRHAARWEGGSGRPSRVETTTTGWRSSCPHVVKDSAWEHTVPAVILDPFAGSGTVGLVAQRLSRRAVLIDLNADYLGQVMDRNRDIPLGLGA
jgi:DNA modification methylase